MPLPARVAAFLAERERRLTLPGESGHGCEGAKFHSPTPMFCRETRLVPAEWDPDFAGPTAWLCGTCRDNLAVLQQMLYATSGTLDWPVRREFGNQVRLLAERGWKAWAQDRAEARPA